MDMGVIIYFFFQAEDGIRDIGVTGVQTCALPILQLSDECMANSKERRRLSRRDQRASLVPASVFIAIRNVPGPERILQQDEIGRASCRERVQISVVAVSLKKKPASLLPSALPASN